MTYPNDQTYLDRIRAGDVRPVSSGSTEIPGCRIPLWALILFAVALTFVV